LTCTVAVDGLVPIGGRTLVVVDPNFERDIVINADRAEDPIDPHWWHLVWKGR
jgi:hypothetical protein